MPTPPFGAGGGALPGLFLSTSTCAAHAGAGADADADADADAGAAEQRQLCILAVDHDRCAANIATNNDAEQKTKELATLLLKFAEQENCTYRLVTFSNRQSDAINDWLNKTGDKPPRVNILHLEKLAGALAFAEPGLKDRLEVYPNYVVPANFYDTLKDRETWEAKLKKEVSKTYISDAIFKLFGDQSSRFIFVDDNFGLLPPPEQPEQRGSREVRCIQFAPSIMGSLSVEWNKRLF